MRHTVRRTAVAVAVAVMLALVAAPAAEAEARAARRGPVCTTTLVYEHSGTDYRGAFVDRAYERRCPGQPVCTLYYTTTAAGTRLVWSTCAALVTPRRF